MADVAIICKEPDCELAPTLGGWCQAHGNEVLNPWPDDGDQCSVNRCQESIKYWRLELCATHYMKQWLAGRTPRPKQKTGRKSIPKRPCAVQHCDRWAHTRGWCLLHYDRWRRIGDVKADQPIQERNPPVCVRKDCDRRPQARGLCQRHYQQWRLDRPERSVGIRRDQRPCEIDECPNTQRSRGLCEAHYQRQRRFGNPLAGGPIRNTRRSRCLADGCAVLSKARGYCELHYERWMQHGQTDLPGLSTCKERRCERPVHGFGWCGTHYAQWRRTGDPVPLKRAKRKCEVSNCRKPHMSRGMCPMHYRRWKLYGDPNEIRKLKTKPPGSGRRPNGPCRVEGCDRYGASKGLCKPHRDREVQFGDPLAGLSLRSLAARQCSIEGCVRRAICRGWCNTHYQKWYRWGDPLAEASPRWHDCLACGQRFQAKRVIHKFCSAKCYDRGLRGHLIEKRRTAG